MTLWFMWRTILHYLHQTVTKSSGNISDLTILFYAYLSVAPNQWYCPFLAHFLHSVHVMGTLWLESDTWTLWSANMIYIKGFTLKRSNSLTFCLIKFILALPSDIHYCVDGLVLYRPIHVLQMPRADFKEGLVELEVGAEIWSYTSSKILSTGGVISWYYIPCDIIHCLYN